MTSPHRIGQVLAGVDGLQVHLQPVVDLATGGVWGLEALARFPGHPQPGPAEWFAAALRAGRGPELEQVALRGALAVGDQLPAGVALTVNLSAAALLTPEVRRALMGSAPRRLVVEVTEHEPVLDYPELVGALAQLRRAGVRLAIDDFGAGHANLRHVLRLGPDVVKLDLSLSRDVHTDPARRRVVAAMVAFCTRVGVLVIAEGVEQAAELDALRDLGVPLAQGWHLGRPAPAGVALAGLRLPG